MSNEESLVQWDKIASLKRSHLDGLVGERLQLKARIADLNADVAAIDSKIAASLMKADVKTVGVGEEIRVTFVPPGPSQSFNKAVAMRRLLELGVDGKKVEKAWKDATTEKERSAYVKVTVKGDRERGEE